MNDQLTIGQKLEVPFKYNEKAIALKTEALESAALIGKVNTSTDNESAVVALTQIKTVLKAVEAARVEFKKHYLDACAYIDKTAKDFVDPLKKEELRIATLTGNYIQLEAAKQRAAEAARLKEINEIERRKQEELAQAKSHDELDAIHERANQEAAMLPAVKVAKAAGQTVTEDYEFTIVDKVSLVSKCPDLVEVTLKLREAKALAKTGMQIPGVLTQKITKAGVRLQRESALIEA